MPFIERQLRETGADPADLIFEITETVDYAQGYPLGRPVPTTSDDIARRINRSPAMCVPSCYGARAGK